MEAKGALTIVERALTFACKVWILLVLALVAFAGLCYFAATRPPTVGEHVAATEAPLDLPIDASDACYFIPAAFGPCTAFEFSVSEPGFRAWAQSRGWPLKVIDERPYGIMRYTALVGTSTAAREAKIKRGLYYQWNEEDRGIYVAYDADEGRAYYMSHTR